MIDVTNGNFLLFLSTLANTAPRWPTAEFVFHRVGDLGGNRFASILVGACLEETDRRKVCSVGEDGSVLSQVMLSEAELVACVTKLAEGQRIEPSPPAACAPAVPNGKAPDRAGVQLGLF